MTCGQGVSCQGQCSALGASLSQSGKCTHDDDDDSTCTVNSDVTGPGSDLKWCLPHCRVIKYNKCCFNPNCLEKPGRKKLCKWLDYLVGKKDTNISND